MADPYFRFVVCIDVEGDTLGGAYTKLREGMKGQPFGWETTEEAYSPDGEQIDVDVLETTLAQELAKVDD